MKTIYGYDDTEMKLTQQQWDEATTEQRSAFLALGYTLYVPEPDQTAALIRAAKAIFVAIQCDASQGGDIATRLHKVNPYCVNVLISALSETGNLPSLGQSS